MVQDHSIVKQVQAAAADPDKADALIRQYMPFIRSEAAKAMGRPCTDQDDEYSIAMMAFYEAIGGYAPERGAFLPYAAMLIRSRIIDHQRKEARHRGHLSLHEQADEDAPALVDTLADPSDPYRDRTELEATQQEIAELAAVMAGFGVSFADVAENAPRQDRTLAACGRAVRYAAGDPELLQTLLKTKKLPLAQLAAGSGVERKTLERHRKYVLVMLLIQTNGYEIIRGHIRHVLQKGGIHQ